MKAFKQKKIPAYQTLHAIELFDKNDVCVLRVGFLFNPNAQTRDIYLEEGERIVGIKSRIE